MKTFTGRIEMHLNSELLFRKYQKDYFKPGIKVLEIGPAGFPSAYCQIVNDPSIQWDTIDFESTVYIDTNVSNLTFNLYDPYSFPIPENSYDLVVSGQVIEHVQEIWKWMAELKRIVKREGIIFTINPVSWPYHEAPIDCWRIFPSGMESLASHCDLEIVTCLFESEELNQLLKRDKHVLTIPGKSYNFSNEQNKMRRILKWNRFLNLFPKWARELRIPIEVSYDTISILRKK
ncbi:MAG: methyltransferase domain-containing protein [Algoriphagus sp.]|uniref:methyltransferase domain-containing protein n=1 Tax=Algoriphagus sp. TaxID=1872435 RepID=UPI0032815583